MSNKLLFLLLVLRICLARHPVNVKIGAIFNENEDANDCRRAFECAIGDLQETYEGVYNFIPLMKIDVPLDAVKVMHATCELIDEGASIIFCPKHADHRKIVASVADRLQVPHVIYSFMKEDDTSKPSTVRFNAYPSAKILDEAIAQAEKMINWNTYVFVYQTNDALSRIVRALPETAEQQRVIEFKSLPPVEDILKMEERYRDAVYEKLAKDLKKNGHSTLLVDVQRENLLELLLVMKKMDIIGDYFTGLISNLEASVVDMGRINTKDTVANFTYFRFVSNESIFKSVEAAVLYDAVMVYGNVIESLNKFLGHRKLNEILKSNLASCSAKQVYGFGRNISEVYRKKARYGRYTGLMRFNEIGERDFEMEMVNAQGGRENVIGIWRDNKWIIDRNKSTDGGTLSEAAKSKIFKVTTRIGAPFLALATDPARGRYIGEKLYEGYVIDLFEKIEDYLKIKVEFYLVPDGNYGSKDSKTKKWNGLIGELLALKADFAICDLTITSERQSAVDFTAPFMNLGISILFSRGEKQAPDLFAFLSPLSTDVWICMATAYLVVSLLIFFFARIAPAEWVNPHPCKASEDLENNFSLTNTFWLTIGSLMQQGCDILPRASSIRMATVMWWFFALIMVSSYTANLAAFLTATKMEDSINDINDLAKQTKIAYGALKGGSTYSFFKNSNSSLHQRIFNTMIDAKPSVFTKTNDEGVDRVIKGKRKYAFFMESTSIEYQFERHCELQQVGSLLDSKGYGIALPPNSPYRSMMSTAILHLQEKGELQSLKNKWWRGMGGGKCLDGDFEPMNSNELGMPHVGGVFLVLMLGCLISTLIGILEFVWSIQKIAIENKVTPWRAFLDELNFITNLRLETKPVNTSLD